MPEWVNFWNWCGWFLIVRVVVLGIAGTITARNNSKE